MTTPLSNQIIREITPLSDKDCFYIAERYKTEFTYPIHNHSEFELNFTEKAAGVRRIVGDSSEVIGDYDLAEPWKVTLVDTGLYTMTGGRIKRIQDYIGNEPFMMTYGDGVCDVDLNALLKFHKEHGRIATMTTVNIAQMKGVLDITQDNVVKSFREKDEADASLINGGFMVLNPEIFNYLEDDTTVFEKEPLQRLAAEGQLMSFHHNGFWQCMDTQREMKKLEELWQSGHAPWKIWE